MAHEQRQRHRDPETVMDPQPREVGAEARVSTGHAKVGRQRHPQTAADGRSLDRGHHRKGAGEQPHRMLV